MIKQQVIVAGVNTIVAQSELTRRVIGQDDLGDDIYGDFYKYYNEDMTVDIAAAEAEEAKEALNAKLAEAKEYLNKTDHKDLPSYKPKPNEDIATIIATRDEYREFIRANKED